MGELAASCGYVSGQLVVLFVPSPLGAEAQLLVLGSLSSWILH